MALHRFRQRVCFGVWLLLLFYCPLSATSLSQPQPFHHSTSSADILRHRIAATEATATPYATDNPDTSSRRSALMKMAAVAQIPSLLLLQTDSASAADGAVSTTIPPAAGTETPIRASWTATQGLNSLNDNSKNFVGFNPAAYSAMVKDASRTPLFEQAIIHRLQQSPSNSVVVLDLGTGPFALFAVVAAQHGAQKVYAIEANPQAAELAQQRVQSLGYGDVIEIITGFSTDITLPQKVDVCIAEIVGSVASEEGAYATLADAAQRLVKEPQKSSSWIPNRLQTYAAPASYTLHNLLTPPAFDWTKLDGEPVRFNCRDQGLQLLADPVLVEDIEIATVLDTAPSSGRGKLTTKKDLVFEIDPQRVQENTIALEKEIGQAARYLKKPEVQQYARQTASSVTGLALWPRLVLDDTTVVNSRTFPTGQHQKSHWQTVLPIMTPEPIAVVPGQSQIKVALEVSWPTSVTQPPTYKMEGKVIA